MIKMEAVTGEEELRNLAAARESAELIPWANAVLQIVCDACGQILCDGSTRMKRDLTRVFWAAECVSYLLQRIQAEVYNPLAECVPLFFTPED